MITNQHVMDKARELAMADGRTYTALTAHERGVYGDRALELLKDLITEQQEHTYIWTLGGELQFPWTKSGAHAGHTFTVRTVRLELAGGMAQVRLAGPWHDGQRPDDMDANREGWQFLHGGISEDRERLAELPAGLRQLLEEYGLEIPEPYGAGGF